MYIGESLDSYFHYWKRQPYVFCEPGTGAYQNRSKVLERHNEDTLGCVLNWLNAANYLLDKTDDPFIMLCEDDILWLDGAKDKIETLLKILSGKIENRLVQTILPLSSIGFVSGYCSQVNTPKGKGWQEASYRLSGWCGALNLVFPRQSLEYIVEDRERFLEAAKSNAVARVTRIHTGPVHLDYAIGKILRDGGKKLLVHSPTLIQHLGDVSTFASNNKPVNRLNPHRLPDLGLKGLDQ